MRVIEEREYAVLYDNGYYWVIEDKIFRNFQFKRQAATKTAIEMVFDFVELPNGDEVIARVYIPKDIPKDKVLQDLENWNKRWLKKRQQLETLMALFGMQKESEESSDWEAILKKYGMM
jgi:hypothetical protein